MRMVWLGQFHHFTAVDDFGDRAGLAFATNEIRATPIDRFVRAAIFDEFRTVDDQWSGTMFGADEFGWVVKTYWKWEITKGKFISIVGEKKYAV